MKRRGGLAVPIACALALTAPIAAGAKPSYVVRPKGLHLSAALPATNGYEASITTKGHRQVTLTFFQGSYSIAYKALGRVTRSRISADFGRLGSVSLRFRGKRSSRGPSSPFLLDDCTGRRGVQESGLFLGNVRFKGERGFTRARAHRLKGTVVRSYRRVCKGPSWLRALAKRGEDYEGKAISATASDDGVKRTFTALEATIDLDDEPFGLALVVAKREEKVEDVAIAKTAFLLAENIVHLSPRGESPVTAKVSPWFPFVGSASYSSESEPATWTGSLGIRFPGSGQVSLAGPEFGVEFCRAGSLRRFLRCAESISDAYLPYGSGSHSQPLALARLSSLR
ncbi:MAG TPA: hypothetical protein VNC15_04410 [Solirubrobacterales bacterium]|jgi:hypothetical protein|nr:hypothetical protein [Solirubrobacterales bacterium]